MNICFFGLGEAGGLIAKDLAAHDVAINAYDPADVNTPSGVSRHHCPRSAVKDADLVLALTAGADSEGALTQAIDSIPSTAVYADFASASPGLKQQLAAIAAKENLLFCDVALMAMVPGNGLGTPSLVSGSGANQFVTLMKSHGMPVDAVSDVAGEAAQRKLLRSVSIKGLAAVLIESLEAATTAGCEEWLWDNLCDQFAQADRLFLRRMVEGTQTHALRRMHEMQASQQMLTELGLQPTMTTATVKSLEIVQRAGVPAVPEK